MNRLYQKTFNQVHMPEKHYQSLRETLASQCSQSEMEANDMKRKHSCAILLLYQRRSFWLVYSLQPPSPTVANRGKCVSIYDRRHD